MKYMVPMWGVILLALLATVSVLLAFISSVFMVQARRTEHYYIRQAQYVDSAFKEWISRGCAPRTVGPPP